MLIGAHIFVIAQRGSYKPPLVIARLAIVVNSALGYVAGVEFVEHAGLAIMRHRLRMSGRTQIWLLDRLKTARQRFSGPRHKPDNRLARTLFDDVLGSHDITVLPWHVAAQSWSPQR